MAWNWLRRHPWLIDGALVAALGLGYIASAAHDGRGAPGILLAAATVLPLYWRRRFPITVLAIVTVAAAVAAFAYSDDVPVAPALAIYTVAAHVERRRSLTACAAAIVGLLAVFAPQFPAGQTIPNALLFVAAWLGGDSLGT